MTIRYDGQFRLFRLALYALTTRPLLRTPAHAIALHGFRQSAAPRQAERQAERGSRAAAATPDVAHHAISAKHRPRRVDALDSLRGSLGRRRQQQPRDGRDREEVETGACSGEGRCPMGVERHFGRDGAARRDRLDDSDVHAAASRQGAARLDRRDEARQQKATPARLCVSCSR